MTSITIPDLSSDDHLDTPRPLVEHAEPLNRRERHQAAARLEAFDPERMHKDVLSHLVGLHQVIEALRATVTPGRPRVLWSGLATIGADGAWSNTSHSGSRAIWVLCDQALTVAASSQAVNAPVAGPGVFSAPANTGCTFNAETMTWTLYAPAGTLANVTVFGAYIDPGLT